jgi:hypothetical protein
MRFLSSMVRSPSFSTISSSQAPTFSWIKSHVSEYGKSYTCCERDCKLVMLNCDASRTKITWRPWMIAFCTLRPRWARFLIANWGLSWQSHLLTVDPQRHQLGRRVPKNDMAGVWWYSGHSNALIIRWIFLGIEFASICFSCSRNLMTLTYIYAS